VLDPGKLRTRRTKLPTRNYYLILGISQKESQSGIQRAFRDLVRRYHPDRAGPRATPFFQEIVTAYRTLSDPQKRASYDEGLAHAEAVEVAPRSPARAWPEPEPLVPAPMSVMHDFRATRPSRDEIFHRIRRNFTEDWAPKAERLRPLGLEILIPYEAAVYGGMVTLAIPVFYPCHDCRGSGYLGRFPCGACGAEGMVEVEEPVGLQIPAGVRDGSVFTLPLRGLGIHNLFLTVRIRVGR